MPNEDVEKGPIMSHDNFSKGHTAAIVSSGASGFGCGSLRFSHYMLALLHPLDSILLILWPVISSFTFLQCLLYFEMAQVIVHLLKYCVLQSRLYNYLCVF